MDITFSCPHCNQEMAADETAAGSQIECPSCSKPIAIPESMAPAAAAAAPAAPAEAAPQEGEPPSKEEKHFIVPVRDAPTEVLVAAKKQEAKGDGIKRMKIRCIRRTECVEVGKDHFEEVVAEFLTKTGEENVISLNTINYTHIDMGTRQILTDYGVLIVYRG